MTDAQRSLEFLQGLTVECPNCEGKPITKHYKHDGTVTHGPCKSERCKDGTVPKYPSLSWGSKPPFTGCTIEQVSLNDLLVDAAKRECQLQAGVSAQKGFSAYAYQNEDESGTLALAATPIEAALEALGKAEGQPEVDGTKGEQSNAKVD